jgi:uridine kinase
VSGASAHAPADAVAAVAARLRALPPRTGDTRVLAVDGRSGAGKSTFARDGLEAGIDLLVDAILEPIAHGRPGSVPRWDYAADDWGTPTPLPPPAILVVDGVGAGARRAARYASLVVWLELDEAQRRERALARDREMYRPHWERWARQEEALLDRERTRERADVVLGPGGVPLPPTA